MKNKNLAISFSIGFTCFLIFIRVFKTLSFAYVFLIWNLFLAIIPLAITNYLFKKHKHNYFNCFLLILWILFFPNTAYIITDLYHFKTRVEMPQWYDMLIVISAAWNGIILGVVSLFNVEMYLNRFISAKKTKLVVAISCLLCGFGVYLGRYLRFNSWDIVNDFYSLCNEILIRFIFPLKHLRTWSFTILFSLMFFIFYNTLKFLVVSLNNKTTKC